MNKIAPLYETSLEKCSELKEKTSNITAQVNKFWSQEDVYEQIFKIYFEEKFSIDWNLHNFPLQWSLGEYFGSGAAWGDIQKTLIDSYRPKEEPPIDPKAEKVILYAPLESSAGYLYSFTNVDRRKQFYDCYRPD